MATILGYDDDGEGRAALGRAGVRLHSVVPGTVEIDEATLASALPDHARSVRGEMTADVPDEAQADVGMGAWHVNDVDELHVVTAGRGIMQFLTPDGPVAVVVEGGDVIEIHRAEHRYRPLTEQGWIIRHAAEPDADMVASETGRAPGPWPTAP